MTLTSYAPDTIHALQKAPFDTIIDARAPSEFAEDHVPGAINLPVLSNAERAKVGTIYKQDSPFMARKLGAALVAQNAAHHLQTVLADKPGGWQPLIYCWRGGQRSGSFATILSQIGWRVAVLEGGYKSWRCLVLAQLYDTPFPARVIVLNGGTGTGKTDILAQLEALGAQVIDLEALACHRGSVFGSTGAQPPQKLFETRLAQAVAALDPARPVIIEGESNRIGAIRLPPTLWDAMRRAEVVEITAPLEARARYIAAHYAELAQDRTQVAEILNSLRKHHSAIQIAAWQALSHDPIALSRDLIAAHYDARYARATKKLTPLARIALPDLSKDALTQAAQTIYNTVTKQRSNS
jgi:tRNA 2-selenouridine synthase